MRRTFSQSLGTVALLGILVLCFGVRSTSAAEKATTGPETEKRFPPLTVPKGFKATLFACDPLIEYPSVISIGPKQGSLYVAYDYTTGLGIEIVKRDEVRLVSDTDGDGYADKSQLYAGGFNSIQGLAYHDGAVYVMHAPLLTSLRDTDGDGVADQRRDLLKGLGLPPEENPNRLHCANGVVVGHDGWLYLALGDRGCDVRRPEGDRLLFQEGGILRCRNDGRDLHVFASGLRNIYDVALDEELNVFVRDNENDGGDYMIRVCHCFHGSDHGYPYLYRERPAEAMPPLADLGRGSSAGVATYLETAFPGEFRNSLYGCEWGRAVVRYKKTRSGSSFQSMQEVDFAAGSTDDPYGFKPTDLVVDYDGSLLISDWCDGQRPRRGRGRIYRISAVGKTKSTPASEITPKSSNEQLLTLLNSASYHQRFAAQTEIQRRVKSNKERGQQILNRLRAAMTNRALNVAGRLHAIWIIAHGGENNAVASLLKIAQNDPDPRVRAQAVRATADLTDPVFIQHKIAAGRGDARIAAELANLAKDADRRVVLEVLTALGRLHWSGAPQWLSKYYQGGDPAIAHAAMQLLRRANNWPAVLRLLDLPDRDKKPSPSLRVLTLQALAERADQTIVGGVAKRLQNEADPARRRQYVDLLSRVYKKPAEWVYWGFRPAPRPANTVDWKETARIGKIIDRALADADHSVRKLALTRMRREEIPIRLAALDDWLRNEKNADNAAAILAALEAYSDNDIRRLLTEVISSKLRADENRLAALRLLRRGMNRDNESQLIALAGKLEDGPTLAAVLTEIGARPGVSADRLLLKKLDSRQGEVRAAALAALGRRKVTEVSPKVVSLLNDPDPRVRRTAAAVAGPLKVRDSVAMLLKAAGGKSDAELRRASLESLRQLGEPGAVSLAVDALEQPETHLAALRYLQEFGGPPQLAPVSRFAATNRSVESLTAVVRALSRWKQNRNASLKDRRTIDKTLAQVQGDSGFPLLWSTMGPVAKKEEAEAILQKIVESGVKDSSPDTDRWRPVFSAGTDAVVNLPPAKASGKPNLWLGMIDLEIAKSTPAQFLASSDGSLQVWINGKPAYSRDKPGTFQPNSDRFEATLTAGTNRLLVKVSSASTPTRFHVRLRQKSSKAEHERLTRLVLEGRGNVARGKELFANIEKSLCMKCHRIGDTGGKIGPDLTGIGSRFSRIHLIESILEPSRTVAPSYGTTVVELASGKILSGVKIAETPETLTLGDKEGKQQVIPRGEIEAMRTDRLSIMPEGLEKRMTDRELRDLIAFLLSQKKRPAN